MSHTSHGARGTIELASYEVSGILWCLLLLYLISHKYSLSCVSVTSAIDNQEVYVVIHAQSNMSTIHLHYCKLSY